MNKPGDTQAYDAFGEKLPAFCRRHGTAIGAQARMASIAVFWSLVLLLAAGRVHYASSATPAPLELAAR